MIAVWAPDADQVRLQSGGQESDMHARDQGWWVTGHTLEHGQDYTFEVDGHGGLPDPRSPWQPFGVHGPSRYVDHSRYAWHDAGWQPKPLSAAILYELHVGTFTDEGTFAAIIPRLDHLAALGVTHLELMPVAEFPGRYGWGYDGVDLYAPHHAYGGPDGLKTLVDACHARGIAVLLDVVYNHLGPSGNYLSHFGPYFTDRHGTPWGPAINFDGPHSDQVRRYFCDNALMWLRDYHFDGLRLDAVHAIVDNSAIPFLEQLVTEVKSLEAHLGRHLVLIAESDLNDPRIVRPPGLGGYGLHAQWCDDVHHAIHSYLTGEQSGYYADFGQLEHLATALQRPYVYAGQYSAFRRRSHGRPPHGTTADQFVVYAQNHDQIGNRARGERLHHLTGYERAKIAAALVLLSPYVPMLFQGEEWAASSPFFYFVDLGDQPELAHAASEGRRQEFADWGWAPEEFADPTHSGTLERSRLNWSEPSLPAHVEMFNWHRSLIALRGALPELAAGPFDQVEVEFDRQQNALHIHRGDVVLLCNLSPESLELSMRAPCDNPILLLASNPACQLANHRIHLPPHGVAVVGAERHAQLWHLRRAGQQSHREVA